jgi:hypothetical protein
VNFLCHSSQYYNTADKIATLMIYMNNNLQQQKRKRLKVKQYIRRSSQKKIVALHALVCHKTRQIKIILL